MVAIIYLRVSTEEQAKHGYSLQDQRETCAARARALGATEIVECADEGVSGELLSRPGVDRARELVRDGHAQLFVCTDPDRLARNLTFQLIVTEEIEKAGCRLEFVNFDLQKTAEGRLFYTLRGAIAEYEKAKIKDRVTRGRLQKAKQKQMTHNPRIYGYRFNKDRDVLEVDNDQAEIVKFIYDWYTAPGSEETPNSIAAKLNSMGVPAASGIPWQRQAVRRILRYETYTGLFHLRQYDSAGLRLNRFRPKEERVSRKRRPREEWIAVEVPAVISREQWAAAQRKLDAAKRLRPGVAAEPYLLSGLLRCGVCGAPMHGKQTQAVPLRRHYVCRERYQRDRFTRTGARCTMPYVPAEDVDSQVWETVQSWLRKPELLRREWDKLGDRRARRADSEPELRMIERQAKAVVTDRGKVVRLLTRELLPEAEAEAMLADLRTREASLTARRTALLAERVTAATKAADLRSFESMAAEVRDRLEFLNIKERQTLLRMVIAEATIYPDGNVRIRPRAGGA
ncbi:MAG: recombinase family protein [Symbiobacteriia bacterium]